MNWRITFILFIISYIFIVFVFLISNRHSNEIPDSRRDAQKPQIETTSQPELQVIGKWQLQSGWLYSYKVNNDTIYIMGGKSSSYPVSMQVK